MNIIKAQTKRTNKSFLPPPTVAVAVAFVAGGVAKANAESGRVVVVVVAAATVAGEGIVVLPS